MLSQSTAASARPAAGIHVPELKRINPKTLKVKAKKPKNKINSFEFLRKALLWSDVKRKSNA